MSDILVAEGFGNLTDGSHPDGSDREILGTQWVSFERDFFLTDRGDGRKWISTVSYTTNLQSYSWAGKTTIFVAFRLKKAVASNTALINFYDGTSWLGVLGINAAGSIVYTLGANSSPTVDVVATSVGTVPLNTETHVEVKIVFNNSAGSVKIWLNGVLDSDTTGKDTIKYGTSCTCTRWLGGQSYTQSPPDDEDLFGDFIVHSAADALGDLGVYYLPVDADGVDADFTPSAGDNYQCVDEIGPDEDTTYNESDGTAGHRDSFETAGVSGMTVHSVGVLARARKTDTGAATLLLGAVHGGSEDQSAAKTLSEDYLTLVEFFDTCPSTAAAWSAAEVTAAELSCEVGA